MSFEFGLLISAIWLIACWYVRNNAYDRGYGHGYIKGVQDGYHDGKQSVFRKMNTDDDGNPLHVPEPIPQ